MAKSHRRQRLAGRTPAPAARVGTLMARLDRPGAIELAAVLFYLALRLVV